MGLLGVDLVVQCWTSGGWRGPGTGTCFLVGVRFNEEGKAVVSDGGGEAERRPRGSQQVKRWSVARWVVGVFEGIDR